MNLEDVHLRGTRASQPDPSDVAEGTIYCVSDENDILEMRDDTLAWVSYSPSDLSVAPPPNPAGIPNTFLVAGGQVVWDSGYVFRVSAADYYINGTHYTSIEQTVTLTAADGTNDRIDVIILDTSSTVGKIDGTAAALPSEPFVDGAQYLKLALVLVAAATTEPPTITNEAVYAEAAGHPAEWAWTSSGGSIVVNSSSNPRTGTKDIEGTNVVSEVYAQGEKGASGTIDPNSYDHLRLFIRSKATWNNSRGLYVSLRSAGVLVGVQVIIRRSGTFGFDSSTTGSYQQIAIPITAFAVTAGTTINQVRIQNFGGSIGFYIDDISFQANASTGSTAYGISQEQADARYAPLIHATRHQSGGADAIKLDDLAAPDDNTDLNSTTTTHGLLRKLSGSATDFLNGVGAWAVPSGGSGDVVGPASATDNALARFDATTGKLIQNSVVIVADDGTITLPDNIRQTFNPGANNAGLNVGSHTADPSTPSDGDIYYDSTNNLLRARVNGAWISLGASSAVRRQITIVIDGGGAVITTGVKGYHSLPVSGTWKKWRILSTDATPTSGSIVIDIWKDTYANYYPTVADTITASDKPTVSSATKAEGSSLTGWTTAFTAGDCIGINVDSVSSFTKVSITLEYE